MELTEAGQHLLAELWIAQEETHTTVAVSSAPAEAVDELTVQGLASRENGHLTLTKAGVPAGRQMVRRRRLAERLLADVLTIEEERLDAQACRVEHVLQEGLDDKICTLLGHPRFCPHGRPIPEGECCRERATTVGRLVAPLNELQAGQKGRIAYIHMHNPQRLQKLMAMGVLPGSAVTLIRRTPSVVFEAGYSQFAVDEDIASDIYVRLES